MCRTEQPGHSQVQISEISTQSSTAQSRNLFTVKCRIAQSGHILSAKRRDLYTLKNSTEQPGHSQVQTAQSSIEQRIHTQSSTAQRNLCTIKSRIAQHVHNQVQHSAFRIQCPYNNGEVHCHRPVLCLPCRVQIDFFEGYLSPFLLDVLDENGNLHGPSHLKRYCFFNCTKCDHLLYWHHGSRI